MDESLDNEGLIPLIPTPATIIPKGQIAPIKKSSPITVTLVRIPKSPSFFLNRKMKEVLSIDGVVYQKCIDLQGNVFGSKDTGPFYQKTVVNLLSMLRKYYGHIYQIKNNYYIFDRYSGFRYKIIISQIQSLYYAVLVKDLEWI